MATNPLSQVPLPKRTMLVAREDGQLYQVDFTEHPELDDPGLIDWGLSVSKLLIGKIQISRSKYVTVEELEFENIVHTDQVPPDSMTDLEVTVYNSIDGKNVVGTTTLIPSIDLGGLIKLPSRISGQNFSVQLRGTYNVNTFIVTTHPSGRR